MLRTAWRQFFAVPTTDPDDARRRRLLTILLSGIVIVALLTLIATLLGLVTDVASDRIFIYEVTSALLVGCAVIFVINRFWVGWVASTLFLFFLTVVVAFSDHPQELVNGRSLYQFVVPVIMASVLLRSYSSFIFAAVVDLFIVAIAIGAQLTPNVPAMFGFGVIAIVSWLSSRGLEQALHELRALNRELDQRVQDRTRELQQALVREQAETSKTQAILLSIADGVVVFDNAGRATVANPAISSVIERSATRVLNRSMTELMEGNVPPQQQELVAGLLPGGTSPDSPVNVDWGNKTLSLSIAPLRSEAGEVTGSVTVFRDVSREAEISRMKSAFVSMVSHELRTPLNAVYGFAEILQQSVYGSLAERQMGVVDRILNNTKRLLGIVNDLLDQAHIEAGTLPIYNSTFTPAELVDGVQGVVGGLAQSKGIELETCIEPSVPSKLIGDPQRLGQVLVNLSTNALKFTEHGKVSIRLFCPDLTHWALEVSDTGSGIPDSAQTYIFEPFRQIEYQISRKHGGVGLGLSIVKKLVTLMDGEVNLRSEVGQGSTFTVVLPLVKP